MSVDVVLPQWGMGMTEGTVVEWLVAEGDTVAKGDELVEIDTAKAAQALESPAPGTLARIVAQPGEVVPVRGLLAVIEPG